jgi:hypothetical protein
MKLTLFRQWGEIDEMMLNGYVSWLNVGSTPK